MKIHIMLNKYSTMPEVAFLIFYNINYFPSSLYLIKATSEITSASEAINIKA